MSAIFYAGLVGKYIRMERPATENESRLGEPDMIGMECTVLCVRDEPGGDVGIMSDYGMGFAVRPGEGWRFTVWPDERARTEAQP